jgi:valine--pyruvate aminotransferase
LDKVLWEKEMEFSKFGQKLACRSGIGELMKDLAAGTWGGPVYMLGGGNPAHIPEVERACHEATEKILSSAGAFEKVVGEYDPPQGNPALIEALCGLFRGRLGWEIGPENIALTSGSQTAFFMLFNLLGGTFEGGRRKRILLPMVPEYIGYTDLGIEEDLFVACKPRIEFAGEHLFKYRVDLDSLRVDETIGAICVSRPTNPTANVLTDEEVRRLDELARRRGVPLILDNAYGLPFPNILFTEAAPFWNENTIVCMSLSKLGLPSARIGIVIARREITAAIAEMNAIITLTPSGIGASIGTELIVSGQIERLSRQVIRPFYEQKCRHAMQCLGEHLKGLPYAVHKPEGAFFLWLWLRELPISSEHLYRRLKERGVIVVPGHYFFPGLAEEWPHKQECIRISYAASEQTVEKGLAILGEEVWRIYAGG